MQEGTLTNRNDAYNLLSQLGAPERLLRHAQLVHRFDEIDHMGGIHFCSYDL